MSNAVTQQEARADRRAKVRDEWIRRQAKEAYDRDTAILARIARLRDALLEQTGADRPLHILRELENLVRYGEKK